MSANGLDRLRILVVDDNAQMRTIIGTVLAAAGIRQLYYAPTGQKGLESLNLGAVDVVFVDYEMPSMNGLDFLRQLRTEPGGVTAEGRLLDNLDGLRWLTAQLDDAPYANRYDQA